MRYSCCCRTMMSTIRQLLWSRSSSTRTTMIQHRNLLVPSRRFLPSVIFRILNRLLVSFALSHDCLQFIDIFLNLNNINVEKKTGKKEVMRLVAHNIHIYYFFYKLEINLIHIQGYNVIKKAFCVMWPTNWFSILFKMIANWHIRGNNYELL